MAAAVSHPISAGARSPFELAALDSGDVEQLIAASDDRPAARDFWRAARLSAATASSPDPLFLAPNDITARSPQKALRRHNLELQRSSAGSSADHPGLRFRQISGKTGPVARIEAIRASRQASARLDRFSKDRTQANMQVRVSPPGHLIGPKLIRILQ